MQSYLSCSEYSPSAFVATSDVFARAMETIKSTIHLVGSGFVLNHPA